MAVRLFFSSGNLLADRRYDFARDLQMRGDLSEAAELMEQACELAPDFASAWFALGELRQELNLHDLAIDAYRKACEADDEDRHGAGLKLMRLGAAPLDEMPASYVRTLFDQYAPKFDKALVQDLDYRGPEILLKAVIAARHRAKMPVRFRRVLDLGCGTGLAALAFVSVGETFVGVDLSPGMIAQAKSTGVYAELIAGDMVEAMQAQAAESFDLVIAADVLVYVRDLDSVLKNVARVLSPGSLIAFTVETHAGDGVVLGAGLRYAHSKASVSDALDRASFNKCMIEPVSTRTELSEPVPGLVVTAIKK